MTFNSKPVTDVLTEREAAQLICFSYRTLQAWRQRNQGPPFIKISRRSIRYSRAALIDWINAQTCSPGSIGASAIPMIQMSHVKPLIYDRMRGG